MTTARPGPPRKPSGRPRRPAFPILESKLTPPFRRDGMVPRTGLLDRLDDASGVPVVAVAAPPGYGKTTLLVQWAERDPRRFAWLSLDGRDNDPVVLLTYIAAALDRLEPVDPSVFRALGSLGAPVSGTVVPRLASWLASRAQPVVLALDDAHLLHDPECLDHLAALVEHLPPGSQLAIAGRGESPLAVARLRAEGRLEEIGAQDLAMDRQESAALLRGAELDLSEARCAELSRRTEGWPVALYLAALSLKMGQTERGEIALVGDDRFLVDYLQSVLLSRLPWETISFLTRSSVLERMCGPLCDAVLGREGSTELLESLERSNLLLIPLDRRRRWYRYHHLFRELLRAKLERGEPGLARELLVRAAVWCEHNGHHEAAIEYAMEAGDTDRVARLVVHGTFPLYQTGRYATLQRWFDWFDEHAELGRHPPVAMVGAWFHLVVGHLAASDRWAEAAERGAFKGRLPDGSTSIEGWAALRRALRCADGLAGMLRDAELAERLLPADSMMRAPALLVLGMAHVGAGAPRRADAILAEAVEVAEDAGATVAGVDALAERAVLAMARDDWREAELLVERARSVIREARLDDYVTTILLYSVAARVEIARAKVEPAHEQLARAQRLRPEMTHAIPLYAVQTRLELVRAYLALTDVTSARTVLREVDDLLRRQPDLGVLRDQAAELHAQLDAMRAEVIGASALTAAELRVLPLLATHHSFREIGERLHLSPHTVKTQAIAIYRKLGVSSRSQAIQHAHDLGLLVG
ncbi:MAG TPA: LuxR C-terminal-related transcriptional regulator [Actinomycetes bacterium]